MRPPVDQARIKALARELARLARQPVQIYLTGGATAVIEGWRESTVDVDLRIEPDDDELYRALPRLKESLQINIELASPPDFIPELPDWRARSPLILREGTLEVRHFDPYSQALSKIERGFEHDISDVRHMLSTGLVDAERLGQLYDAIEPGLYRYPALDAAAFRGKVDAVIRANSESDPDSPKH